MTEVLRWRREAYGRYIEPETWILCAATGLPYARIQLSDGWWTCPSHAGKGPWREEDFEYAKAAMLAYCQEHGRPPETPIPATRPGAERRLDPRCKQWVFVLPGETFEKKWLGDNNG